MSRKIQMMGILLTVLAACALAAAGQKQKPEPVQSAPTERASRLSSRIRENIITLKLLRMTQALNLTQEQTTVIYPALTRLENEKYDITRTLNGAMSDLRFFIAQDKHDEKKLTDLMRTIGRLRDEITSKDREMAEFMRTKLSVVQDAKYMLFSVEFYRGLGERLERLRMFHHGNPFTQ